MMQIPTDCGSLTPILPAHTALNFHQITTVSYGAYCTACRLLKERKAEDHLFGDKDKFVTAAYKKKLEEDQKWLAEEKIREARDAKSDALKAGHMGNFYRCTSFRATCCLHNTHVCFCLCLMRCILPKAQMQICTENSGSARCGCFARLITANAAMPLAW